MKRLPLICCIVLFITANVQAQSRFFIPEFHVGSGADTQLLMNNKDDRDGTVDVWAFSKSGELIGQVQLGLKARGTRSFTLSEMFGSTSAERTGWLAAFSSTDASELSYRVIGVSTESETHEAESVPSRQATVDAASGSVLRLSNPSSVRNTVTARKLDANGAFAGIQEVSIAPFGQVELALGGSDARQHLELNGTGDFLSFIGEKHPEIAARVQHAGGQESRVAIVIDSEVALGAFQIVLSFDPNSVTFSADDVEAGTSEGFDSKPLAVGIDSDAGEIRIASFQVGNHPIGRIDVAHLRMRTTGKLPSGFGIRVEEITDVKGESILRTMPTIRLTRLQ